jgi:RNA polymerase sigma-70 factor, ECF subfamily
MSSGDTLRSAEDELVTRLRAGDRDVLAELFALHRDRLWRMVRFRMDCRLVSRVDPDDILQEAFLAARKRVQSFLSEPDASLYVWLRLVVMQTLCDIHRQHFGAQMRDVRRNVPIDPNADSSSTSACLAVQLAASMTSPSQALAGIELMGRLQQAIESMAPIDQEIIALRHFEELTNAETAAVLRISPAAASNRYVRAIGRLRDILAPFGEFQEPE